MAERIDFTHDQGATFRHRVIWKSDTATPVPVDVSEFTARMQVRESIVAATVIIELTTENGRISLGDTDGVVDLLLEDEATELLPARTYRYDLEMVSPTGEVTRLIEGKFKIRPEVTR